MTITVGNIIFLALMMIYRPFKYKAIHNLKVASEAIFFIGFLLMIIFPVMLDSMSLAHYKDLGWAITYMFYLVLLVETLIIVFTTYLETRSEKLRVEKEKRSRKKLQKELDKLSGIKASEPKNKKEKTKTD